MAITITTTGATFTPVIELAGGSTATVTWSVSGFTDQTGVSPSFSFGSAATRTCTMTVTGGGGYPDVTAFDLGYDNTIDVGHQMPPARFVKSAEAVSGGIGGLSSLTGLIYFLADHTALSSALDFTGLNALQFIQCYGTNITGVTLTGCTALIRLQVEACNLTSALDLNPVAGNLTDLRAAVQQGGTLTLAVLTSPMAAEYHYCTRDQAVVNPVPTSQLPVVQEYWAWHDGAAGALAPVSTALTSLQAYNNQYTSADLTGKMASSSGLLLDLHNCLLTGVTLAGCTGLGAIYLNRNRMQASAVDAVLASVAGFGTSGGTLDVSGNTAPSAAGLASAAALQGRSWTVTYDSPVTSITVPQVKVDNGPPGAGFASAPAIGDSVILVVCSYTLSHATITTSAPLFGGVTPPGSVKLADKMSPLTGGNGVYVAIWLMPCCGDGTTKSTGLTVAGSDGSAAFYAYDISGLGVAPFKDAVSTGGAAASAAVDSGACPPTGYDKELVIGAAIAFEGATTPGSGGWTVQTSPGGHNGWTGYQVSAAWKSVYEWKQSATDATQSWAAALVTVAATDALPFPAGGGGTRHHHRAGR